MPKPNPNALHWETSPMTDRMPTVPWTRCSSVEAMPLARARAIEIHAVAMQRVGNYLSRQLIVSPADGALAFLSVYVSDADDGLVCMANFGTPQEAIAYATEIERAAGRPLLNRTAGVFGLQIQRVEGKGYGAASGLAGGAAFTPDPMKAILASRTWLDLLDVDPQGGAQQWVSWLNAKVLDVDRSTERRALVDRTVAAALNAMGASAPEAGSKDAEGLRDAIADAIDSFRADRLQLFDEQQRAFIVAVLIEDGFEVEGTESDEQFCTWLRDMSPELVFEDADSEFDAQLLNVFASPNGVLAMTSSGGGEIRRGTVLGEVLERLAERGGPNPYEGLCTLEEAESETLDDVPGR